MELIEKINTRNYIDYEISPKEGDIAIVSIDSYGSPGELNKYVLKEYGYPLDKLPQRIELKRGFYGIPRGNKKPILFIVTIGEKSTTENLEKNLFKALIEYRDWFRDKKIWIPLLGTGAGLLNLEESYKIIVRAINKFLKDFPTETYILISIPKDNDGIDLLNKINRSISLVPELVENAFNSFKGKYFFVDSIWGKEDHAPRFFKNNIWENRYEDKFREIKKQVQVGDILFLKASNYLRRNNYLILRGIGVITSIPDSESRLDIDWKLKNLDIEIERIGKYSSSFIQINPIDLDKILTADAKIVIFESGLLNHIENLINLDKYSIADLISDEGSGEDHLDIRKDISAFSKIISAKSFKPPLAVVLFGKWGAGKSFFMNKLRAQIQILSSFESNSPYCKGVAHIHFNAWSYLDANLWASMVSRIFEGLRDYITNDSKAKRFKNEIEKELSKQLTVTKEEINFLEIQKRAIDKQIDTLTKEKKIINDKLEEEIKIIEKKSLNKIISNVNEKFNVKERIGEVLNNNPTYLKTEEDLKQIIPEKYWNDPITTYNHIRSNYTFLKEFFRKDKIKRNLFWLGFIFSAILIIPTLLCLFITSLKDVNFLIPQIGLSMLITFGAIWKRAENVYSTLQPIIASFWTIKVDYEKEINDAIFQHEQKEKVLKLRIDQNKNAIDTINQQIQQAILSKTSLEYRINNALASEALYSFIEKRSNSDDYNKYLGIVSIIRKDFEILSSLFLEHNNEDRGHSLFREKFNNPLERIILYIDDLDRCSEERVVEVLEAVNLLMAFPLFVVVVGVDPRWVKNALIKKYNLQFTGHINDSTISNELEVIEASDYLEKIFQIPFHLKEASDNSVKNMLQTLSEPNKNLVNGQIKEDDEGNASSEASSIKENPVNKNDQSISNNQLIWKDNKDSNFPKHLVLSKQEILLMQNVSEIIGNNPRAIKRFVNIYQIVRAHEDLIYDNNASDNEFLVLMFLLALQIGPYKKLSRLFIEYTSDTRNHKNPLSYFMLESFELEENKLKDELRIILYSNETLNILLNTNIERYYIHNKFIQRFTFANCI